MMLGARISPASWRHISCKVLRPKIERVTASPHKIGRDALTAESAKQLTHLRGIRQDLLLTFRASALDVPVIDMKAGEPAGRGTNLNSMRFWRKNSASTSQWNCRNSK